MPQLKVRSLVRGLATFVPGLKRLACGGSGGTDSARYCYAVWMRHLILARRGGLLRPLQNVAELGPGDSLGIGLCAVLSGTNGYFALDVKPHANLHRNLGVFDQLVDLFRHHAAIPDEREFPKLHPRLSSYAFPDDLLTEDVLKSTLDAVRLEAIRAALRGDASVTSPITIRYVAPWNDPTILRAGSMDMIFSQAVLEHVEDLPGTYRALRQWLHPEGFMSHTIDFKCHGLTRDWAGHWTLGDLTWKLVKGSRSYLINRQPHSVHLSLLRSSGFSVLKDAVVHNDPLPRQSLNSRFQGLSDDDLRVESAFVQSVAGPPQPS